MNESDLARPSCYRIGRWPRFLEAFYALSDALLTRRVVHGGHRSLGVCRVSFVSLVGVAIFGCTGPAESGSRSGGAGGKQDTIALDSIEEDAGHAPVDVLLDAAGPGGGSNDTLDLTDVNDGAIDSGVADSGPPDSGVTKDCFTKADSQEWCCESTSEVTNFCYPVPVGLDAGPAGSGGCGPGKFKNVSGQCEEANCATVSSEIGTALSPGLKLSTIACNKDEDCAVVDVSTSCQSLCPIAVRKDAVGEYQKKSKDIDAQMCVAFSVAKTCGPLTQPGCVEQILPGCVKGYCQAFKQPPTKDCELPKPAGATCYLKKWKCDQPDHVLPPKADACTKNTCANLKAVLKTLLLSQIRDTDRVCLNAADCVIWSPAGFCSPICPIAVSKKRVSAVAALRSQYETFCKVYVHGKCVEKPPICLVNAKVDCVDKQCVVVP